MDGSGLSVADGRRHRVGRPRSLGCVVLIRRALSRGPGRCLRTHITRKAVRHLREAVPSVYAGPSCGSPSAPYQPFSACPSPQAVSMLRITLINDDEIVRRRRRLDAEPLPHPDRVRRQGQLGQPPVDIALVDTFATGDGTGIARLVADPDASVELLLHLYTFQLGLARDVIAQGASGLPLQEPDRSQPRRRPPPGARRCDGGVPVDQNHQDRRDRLARPGRRTHGPGG